MKWDDKVSLMFATLITTNIYAKAEQFVDMSQFEVSSPSMASIKQYHEYPVNYHTGLPEISIPLHSTQEGPISIPISLSYHASGLKVDLPSSRVHVILQEKKEQPQTRCCNRLIPSKSNIV
ncbi:MAG: hypothetical protein AAGF85_07485 [Bacteroidota bacterium]